jgi:hypothetical protein
MTMPRPKKVRGICSKLPAEITTRCSVLPLPDVLFEITDASQ